MRSFLLLSVYFLLAVADDCMYPLIKGNTQITATSSMPGRGPENARLLGIY